ncbi:hypothetical protein [Zoogloea dura]|jgi:hypothetical protein|uniref:Uncharacterized protein n=1 Tax=Zoogloea dura TaxID=2728840 RepID=A0A848FZF2_9RHOO|nr:hypothetical protein [Zoogloea dura]NML24226.1 hypothetical protein [Zoogloea dura]
MPVRHLITLLALLCGASACAVAHPDDVVEYRIIIGFADPVRGDDPQLLARLAKAGARLRFAASLSAQSHAYRLSCPHTSGCEEAMEALRAQAGITHVQTDHIKDPR